VGGSEIDLIDLIAVLSDALALGLRDDEGEQDCVLAEAGGG